jgi:hypothetical protein
VDEIPKLTQRAIIFLGLSLPSVGGLLAASKDEYRRIADSSLATVLR